MSTKKKEKQSTWILPGLCTILTAIATMYCLLCYRDSLLIIGVSTILLLAASYWLFLTIARLIKCKETSQPSVGEQQRERMNYEGMKLQGEELIRLVNTLGKGTYVNTKRTAEQLAVLSGQYEQLQTSNERIFQRLIDEETKLAKFQVKYAQNDTGKLVSAINRINITPPVAPASPAPLQAADLREITESIDSLSADLANINASIQELKLAIHDISLSAAESMVDTTDTSMTEATDMAMTEATDDTDTPLTEIPDTSPDLSSILSDDPNKQLSADEIAALFAALN